MRNIYWPRGLPCALFLRAIVEEEGFMRSGGVVIGGATTRLVSYRYLGGENDASNASGRAAMTPASRSGSSGTRRCRTAARTRCRVELTVETTYDDGTVRTFEFAGSIAATVVYSAISQ